MAATIEVNGYLNEIKQFSWGTVLRVSSANSIKNKDTGEWEVVSRDYYDVTLSDEANIGGISENDRIIVRGSFKVGKQFPKKDGTVGVELKIRATSVELDPRAGAPRSAGNPLDNLASIGAMPIEDAPF